MIFECDSCDAIFTTSDECEAHMKSLGHFALEEGVTSSMPQGLSTSSGSFEGSSILSSKVNRQTSQAQSFNPHRPTSAEPLQSSAASSFHLGEAVSVTANATSNAIPSQVQQSGLSVHTPMSTTPVALTVPAITAAHAAPARSSSSIASWNSFASSVADREATQARDFVADYRKKLALRTSEPSLSFQPPKSIYVQTGEQIRYGVRRIVKTKEVIRDENGNVIEEVEVEGAILPAPKTTKAPIFEAVQQPAATLDALTHEKPTTFANEESFKKIAPTSPQTALIKTLAAGLEETPISGAKRAHHEALDSRDVETNRSADIIEENINEQLEVHRQVEQPQDTGGPALASTLGGSIQSLLTSLGKDFHKEAVKQQASGHMTPGSPNTSKFPMDEGVTLVAAPNPMKIGEDEDVYGCESCDLVTSTWAECEQHMNQDVHWGCYKCEKKFRLEGAAAAHMDAKIHWEDSGPASAALSSSTVLQATIVKSEAARQGRKQPKLSKRSAGTIDVKHWAQSAPLICSGCKRKFKDEEAIGQHERATGHGRKSKNGDKECDVCGNRFKDKEALIQHLRAKNHYRTSTKSGTTKLTRAALSQFVSSSSSQEISKQNAAMKGALTRSMFRCQACEKRFDTVDATQTQHGC